MTTTLLAEVDNIDNELEDLKKIREKKLLDIQDKCKHPLEAIVAHERSEPFITPNNAVFYDAGARCCKLCGYGEEGYSFWKLQQPYSGVPVVGRDVFKGYLKKLYSHEEQLKLKSRR